MATTTNGMEFADLNEAPNGPAALLQLGNEVDAFYGKKVANVAALPVTGDLPGQRVYVEDIDTVAVWNETVGQWEGYEKSYTPVWTGATTNPVIGNGSIIGGYTEFSEWVDYWFQITAGSTTTFGSGSLSVSLPPPAETDRRWLTAFGTTRDASANVTYPIIGERQSPGVLLLRTLPTTAGQEFRSLTGTNLITLANTDVLFLGGSFRRA